MKEKQGLKPFIKWAGGKRQLLNRIRSEYPDDLGITVTKYAEPFVGGGAVLFDVLSKYELNEIYINDINTELINTYKIIRDDINNLIFELSTIEKKYIELTTEHRKLYYYEKRKHFNKLIKNKDSNTNIEEAALFIFLNKTCFNGLYRVNSKGLFNVPAGAYKNPLICDNENLLNASAALQNVIIENTDYKESLSFIDNRTFVYLDPPYRPITETSNFTSYYKEPFDDDSQKELAQYVNILNEKGAKILVSNSDPRNSDINDDFFDELYEQYKIHRIDAKRVINSNGGSRGKIGELLIANY